MHIIGCVVAKELTTCKTGANQHAHIVMRKNVVSGENTEGESAAPHQSETDTMEIAALKRIALMNDVTKSYFGGLEDTAATAFLTKSVADQDTEAAEAKKALDDKAAEIEAEKSGKTVKEAALEKSVADLRAENAEIKKAMADNAATAEIEKTASAPEFDGYPGGKEALVPLLKSFQALPEAERTAMTEVLKANAAAAKKTAATIGKFTTDADFVKSNPAHAEIAKKVADLQTKDPELSASVAKARVLAAHPNLMTAALEEENALN